MGKITMSKKSHVRIFIIATLVWFFFFLVGVPDYYLQYSTRSMVWFVILLLIPISVIIYAIFRQISRQRRLTISLWYAFYFTIPLAVYDGFYCGLYLGYGLKFLTVFWFLSIFYLIPWLLFPLIASLLNQSSEN
jgi:hypothetical protein